jgi:tripartite-type tricarboxylate transporter receptor subunit TctC
MRRRNWVLIPLILIGILGGVPGVSSGDYPTRAISLVVPFPPGGVADLTARPIAAALEPILKQPVPVVNKAGAGGAVGMQFVAVAKPDGYTLLLGLSSISVMPEVDKLFGRPQTYKKEDFVAIALLNADPTVLAVRKDAPWNSVADFVADGKKRPGEIKYSSAGMYSTLHVAMEMFTHSAGIKLRHIPTQGGGPALTALLGGHVEAFAVGPSVIASQLKAGTVKVLGCWGAKRLASLPDIPTFLELGYKDVEFYIWAGMFAPKATPPEAVKILREATKKAANGPEFKNAMEKLNTPVYYLDGPDFQKFWDKDADRLARAVRNIGKVE